MSIEKQILGLEIPIYDVVAMKVIKSECDFGGIEFGHWIGESLADG